MRYTEKQQTHVSRGGADCSGCARVVTPWGRNTCSVAINDCLNQTVPSVQKWLSLCSTLTLQLSGAGVWFLL